MNFKKHLNSNIKTFKQWVEDTGEVLPRINDDSYNMKGARSKIQQTDKKPKKTIFNPEKIFGKKPK
jgi:prophage antirepressor-like protein